MKNLYKYDINLAGFTMIEMMVVLAIMSIVTIIAIPNYQHVIKKFQYLEGVHEAIPWRMQVEMCYWQHGDFEQCSMGEGGVGVFQSGRSIQVLEIEQGQIKITPWAKRGVTDDDVLLMSPQTIDGRIEWVYEGAALEKGYVSQ